MWNQPLGKKSSQVAQTKPWPLSIKRAVSLLLVEDHAETAHALARLLRQNMYLVVVVSGYRAAVDMSKQMRFDVLLCDLGLPDGDGCALLAEVRRLYPTYGIAITGHSEPEYIDRCRQAGFSAYLVKPLPYEELAAALGRMGRPANT